MGQLRDELKPKADKKDWVSHAFLQYCYEQLTEMGKQGKLELSSVKNEFSMDTMFRLSFNGEAQYHKNICGAIALLSNTRKK